MSGAPSAWTLQHVVGLAQSTIERLRADDGLLIETDGEVLAALDEAGIDVETVLRRLVRAALQAKADVAAAEHRIGELRFRRDRFLRQEEAYRATVLAVLQALNLTKFRDVEASLSVTPGKPKLIITDATQLPPSMVEVVTTLAPMTAEIKAALLAGADVPGAVLSQAPPVLTIRTK